MNMVIWPCTIVSSDILYAHLDNWRISSMTASRNGKRRRNGYITPADNLLSLHQIAISLLALLLNPPHPNP
jgi:hypothetical protein